MEILNPLTCIPFHYKKYMTVSGSEQPISLKCMNQHCHQVAKMAVSTMNCCSQFSMLVVGIWVVYEHCNSDLEL